MAALLVGVAALGVDKIRQHRADRREKGKAREIVAALSSAENTQSQSASAAPGSHSHNGNVRNDEQLPSYEGATSTKPQRPDAARRGRRGYTQFHGLQQQAPQQGSSVHPLERDSQAAASDFEDAQADLPNTNSGFVEDEKERLRRSFAARNRFSDDGRRGRASSDASGPRPPIYREHAPARGTTRRRSADDEDAIHDSESESDVPTTPSALPPSYEAVTGRGR